MNVLAHIRLIALLLGACLAANPVFAEKPEGKGDRQQRKQVHKAQEKAHKHHAKHDRKADRGEKSDKRRAEAHQREDTTGKSAHSREEGLRVGGYFDDRHRSVARSYYHTHYGEARGCPPGLAKKNNGCLPPGQAKKYQLGQPLPREVVHYPVPQPLLVQLPAVPPGYRYVRVGNDIVLLSPQSALVLDVLVNIFG